MTISMMEVTKAELQYCCRPDTPLAPTDASAETDKIQLCVITGIIIYYALGDTISCVITDNVGSYPVNIVINYNITYKFYL